MSERIELRLLGGLALAVVPSLAFAHDFSWVPQFVVAVAILQALPIAWLIHWRLTRAAVRHALILIASWPIAVGVMFQLNHLWPLLLLLAPWIFFATVAFRRRNEPKPAP